MNASSYDDFPSGFTSSSYPAVSAQDTLNPAALSSDDRPRILLMGLKRSGKTSIQKVVFEKMSPHSTLLMDATSEVRIKDIANTPLVNFQVWDFPGKFDFNDHMATSAVLTAEVVFKRSHAVIFVIDGQDDPYTEALDYLVKMAALAYRFNPSLLFEVFIHKVDGDAYLNDDHKVECQQDIQSQLSDELHDANLSDIHLSFYLTSIYDHSIFEAMSKVVQKLIAQLPFLENLLDSLIASCIIEKAFLFDVVSKIYIATDSNPVDMQTYELCSDMIDVVIDVSCIYGMKENKGDSLAYDSESASTIRLSNGYVLYLREVNKFLALVCLMREESYQQAGLVEYNVACLKSALADTLSNRGKPSAKSKPKEIKHL